MSVLAVVLGGLGAVLARQIHTFPMKNQHFSFSLISIEKVCIGAVIGLPRRRCYPDNRIAGIDLGVASGIASLGR